MYQVEYFSADGWVVRSYFPTLQEAMIACMPQDQVVNSKGVVVYSPQDTFPRVLSELLGS